MFIDRQQWAIATRVRASVGQSCFCRRATIGLGSGKPLVCADLCCMPTPTVHVRCPAIPKLQCSGSSTNFCELIYSWMSHHSSDKSVLEYSRTPDSPQRKILIPQNNSTAWACWLIRGGPESRGSDHSLGDLRASQLLGCSRMQPKAPCKEGTARSATALL